MSLGRNTETPYVKCKSISLRVVLSLFLSNQILKVFDIVNEETIAIGTEVELLKLSVIQDTYTIFKVYGIFKNNEEDLIQINVGCE